MKLNLKVGIVGVVAAALIGFAVFGLGQSMRVRADVRAGNVWIMPQHSTLTGTLAAPNATCGTATAGADSVTGGWQVNTTNFPPSIGSFFTGRVARGATGSGTGPELAISRKWVRSSISRP